jgi:hypothetical protein
VQDQVGQTCENDLFAIRQMTTDDDGPCVGILHCKEKSTVLKDLARSNYEVWRMARNEKTGYYVDHIDVVKNKASWGQGGSDNTGLGLAMESIAHSLGWIDNQEFTERITLTLKSLAGETEGFNIERSTHGWMSNFVDSNTGKSTNYRKEMMPTGLSTAGAWFALTYFKKKLESAKELDEVERLVNKIWDSIDFPSLLCDADGTYNPDGVYIPMVTTDLQDSKCDAKGGPSSDGYYNFNEEYYTIWFAYVQSQQKNGGAAAPGIQTMWDRYDGRKFHPNKHY